MNQLEKILKALANRRRLAIVKVLRDEREASVGEISRQIRLSFKSTSKHLAILAGVDLVQKDQRSLSVFYSLSPNQTGFVKSLINKL